ncbi:phosphorylase b kinase gamma catalytic chain, skeletal muscle/heart isoform-like isoform X1 [Eriocheir sinensis]|uniref:phosphorylase b kinase gamma catalytic chain, skeletal muscle/heart isoform-like isoform X1 n=1 Tax=Eriocheir sinensis TaxID=95602 RepID=UPI0021CA5191|nr:phosphorylase b kinase gamma catalytic chain, skeletal muscle/heart isoform-like isoform X1 [Eriocheir sinensis]
MAVDDDVDVLPDRDAAKGFYAKYEPKEVLGRGGCSVVRRCIEKETGQQYAAKIIDLSDSSDEGVYEATKREIEVLRMVAGHPFIIELHDVFESMTFIFLVFELCEHGELFDHLTTVVTLSEKKTKVIMRQLFEALAHVHGKGIVHRDLKPENILLDDNYNIKLTDFGFAKVLQPGETLTELCGTPGYLAPELLRCNMIEGAPGYAHQVDLWACGVIMYTLLVGCPPFWHRKQMVMIRNIMEGKYSFNSPEWEDITDSPKDLISKLLVVDPSRRITVQQALTHDFFQIMPCRSRNLVVTVDKKQYKGRPFNARKMFQFGALCVRAVIRIQRLRYTPEPVSLAVTRVDPYRVKALRKVIDNYAFRVYGHWVKKGEGQDRAALFQNSPKIDYPRSPLNSPLILTRA